MSTILNQSRQTEISHPFFWKGVRHRPLGRGDFRAALQSAEAMVAIAPASPRNVLLLKYVRYSDALTSTDLALLEVLISIAWQEPDLDVHHIAAEGIIRLLGWQRSRQYLSQSAHRLSAGTYRIIKRRAAWRTDKLEYRLFDQITVENDQISFQISADLLNVLSVKERYAYIEPQAMARMRSKWSQAIYRYATLLAYMPGLDLRPGNAFDRTRGWRYVDAKKLASDIGWLRDGQKFKLSVFKREVLDRLDADLAHVAAFKMAWKLEPTSEQPNRMRVSIEPRTPNWRTLITPKQCQVGDDHLRSLDAELLRVPAVLFSRLALHCGVSQVDLYHLWQIALLEAISGEAIDDDCGQNEFRGDKLLEKIEAGGPIKACFDFLVAELRKPGLSHYVGNAELMKRAMSARNARVSADGEGWSTFAQVTYKSWIRQGDGRTLRQIALDHLKPKPISPGKTLEIVNPFEAENREREKRIRKFRTMQGLDVEPEFEPEHVLTEEERIRLEFDLFEAILDAEKAEKQWENDMPMGANAAAFHEALADQIPY